MPNFTRDNLSLRNVSFAFLVLFAFVQCLSISVGNYIFGVFLFLLILSIVSDWKNHRLGELVLRCKANKWWFFAFAFFLLTMLFSAFSSPDILRGLKTWFFHCFYRVLPFFFVLIFFPEPKKAKLLLAICILSCLVDVLVGIYLGPLPGGRYKGIYGHPMTLAGFLCISIPVVFACLFRWDQKPVWLILEFVTFCVLVTGLFLNQTRGAWIALLVTLLLLGLWLSMKSLKKFFFLLVLCVGIFGVFQGNQQFTARFESISSTAMQSNKERMLMWESAMEMFKDDPVFGVGLGQYSLQYQNHYIKPQARERFQNHAHSNIFQMLGENGTVGTLGFLVLFFYIFSYAIKALLKNKRTFAPVMFSVTLALFIQGLTEYNFGNSAVIRFYWLTLACLVVLSSNNLGIVQK